MSDKSEDMDFSVASQRHSEIMDEGDRLYRGVVGGCIAIAALIVLGIAALAVRLSWFVFTGG
jgi:type IV secretory pathway VirB2 component (pilin)